MLEKLRIRHSIHPDRPDHPDQPNGPNDPNGPNGAGGSGCSDVTDHMSGILELLLDDLRGLSKEVSDMQETKNAVSYSCTPARISSRLHPPSSLPPSAQPASAVPATPRAERRSRRAPHALCTLE